LLLWKLGMLACYRDLRDGPSEQGRIHCEELPCGASQSVSERNSCFDAG
jgi:hypothetical protein